MFLALLRRHEGWFSLLSVAALLVLGFISFQALFSYETPPPVTPVAVAQRGDPTLAVYPDRGPGGTYVSVNGSGWPGATEVTISLADAQGESLVLAKETTAADGSLSTGFLYPFEQRWLNPGSYTVIAEIAATPWRVTTPFHVSGNPLAVTVVPTMTVTTAMTPTTALSVTATAPELATPTPLPSPTPTDTALPTPLPTETALPTAVPLPTETPVPPVNQPPQVQAALVPVDVDDDREAGIFEIQITASDPESNPPSVVTILKLPLGERERKPKLKEARKLEIKVTGKEIEIKAPDPQAILDQLTAYGGIVVEAGQQIDLRVKKKGDIKVQWEDKRWRLEAPAIQVEVIATDAGGASNSVQVSSCLDEDCPGTDADE